MKINLKAEKTFDDVEYHFEILFPCKMNMLGARMTIKNSLAPKELADVLEKTASQIRENAE